MIQQSRYQKIVKTVEADYNLVKLFDIVKREVSVYYSITEWQLVHGGNKSDFVFARRIAIYICNKLFATPYQISRSFSCSNHTTYVSLNDVAELIRLNMFSVVKIYGYLSGECLRSMSIARAKGLLK